MKNGPHVPTIIIVLALALGLFYDAWMASSRVRRLETWVAPYVCAQRLGIAYSPDQGATERTDEFAACVKDFP